MNENHYPAGSSGGKGGQFAPKNSQGVGAEQETVSSLSFVPKTTSKGNPRTFFSDLPLEQQRQMESDYVNKHLEIVAVLDYLYDHGKTSKINTPERQFMRKKMINDEFNDQMNAGPKKQEKRATLLLGLPGSGKSTIATPLMKDMGAFIIDADNFKKRIPEFQKDKRMVSAVHHESVNLADEFRQGLEQNGYNMIIGKVGGDYESVGYILDELADNGYQIDVILNDLPFDEAIDRTIGRFDRGETDRLIPFWTLKVADKNVFNTFDMTLKHPAVTGGKIYSNDVKKGEQPMLLKEINK